MPTIPVLMVQYVNDATEIRYSDGSRLELSPCGSVFQFEAPRSESRHPIQGADVVQQRSGYVTSQYRDKLIEALDFRNRFAERPFICQNLFAKEDIVLLHSNIIEAAWPKTADAADVLPDGSIKLTSQDEFASLVLSPHGRDFTICYLSKTSTSPSSTQLGIPKRQHSSPAESRTRHVSGGSNSGISDKSDGSYKLRTKTSKKHSGSKRRHKGSQFGSLTVEPSANSAFVAVSQSHHQPRHQRQSSNPKYSDGESSTHSVQSFDSMTSSVEDELCSSYRELNIQAACKTQKISSISTSAVPKSHSRSRHIDQSNHLSHHISPNVSPISRDLSQFGPVGCVIDGAVQGDTQSKSRQYYCWVTQHVSCSDCHSYWNHPANLVKQRWENLRKQGIKPADVNHNETNRNNNNSALPDKTLDRREIIPSHDQSCVCMCELPPPISLTCAGQHLHSWSQSHDLDTNSYGGKVKVVMSEGVIYRFSGMASLHQIEIYPGDNSVLASEGLTGHFFVHIVPRGDNSLVDEKTYSVKTPPQDFPGSPYSLAKLITRGAQYLANQQTHIQFKPHNDVYCWKYKEETTLSDSTNPPSTIRCEHNVPGLGKFLAYTSGKIRIVFADRTALDMLLDSPYHSNSPGCHGDASGAQTKFGLMSGSVYDSHKARVWGELIPAGHCRLLLPSGQYQLVPRDSPGQFKMYVDYALEWSAWVNTPVSERANFYTDSCTSNGRDISPDTELRKINCFNYIVENTALKQNSLSMDPSGDHHHFIPSDNLCYSATQSLPITTSTNLLQSDQIQSFDDVRRALQKTSQVIHDIDSLLSTRK